MKGFFKIYSKNQKTFMALQFRLVFLFSMFVLTQNVLGEKKEEILTPGGMFFEKAALKSVSWVNDAVIYEVYLRSFSYDSKFGSLESRLLELKNFGVNCLCLMPIQPVGQVRKKGSLGSSYSVKDYYGINLEFGTKDGFKRLVEEAHLEGFKVIMDWVACGTAWDHPLLKSKPDWFLKDSSGEIISPVQDWTDVAGLNYQNSDLRKYMIEALIYWVNEFDIDGFRCNEADRVPIDFWEDARKELVKAKPNILMIAEGDRPEDHLSAFDLTYSRNVYDALVEIAEGKADVTLLDAKLKSEQDLYPRGSLFLHFIENHDKSRAAKVFGPAHFASAVLLFTLDGVPMIYNGQEVAEIHQPSLSEKEVINWRENSKNFSNIRKFYKKLMLLRQEQSSLTRGQRFRLNTSDNGQLFAFACSYRGNAVLVAINFSSKEFKGTMDLPEIFSTENGKLKVKPVFSGTPLRLQNRFTAELVLPPWGYQIWVLK